MAQRRSRAYGHLVRNVADNQGPQPAASLLLSMTVASFWLNFASGRILPRGAFGIFASSSPMRHEFFLDAGGVFRCTIFARRRRCFFGAASIDNLVNLRQLFADAALAVNDG